VPVATVAIGNAENAALLACRMLAVADPALAGAMDAHRDDLRNHSTAADTRVRERFDGGARS
jgi:5-(carboxyamino)imidazole ribonucleotide mutase